MPASKRLAADDELLRLIDTHLALRAGTLTGLIDAVQPFSDDSFQPLLADGPDQIGEAGVELRSLADRRVAGGPCGAIARVWQTVVPTLRGISEGRCVIRRAAGVEKQAGLENGSRMK